ncbi:hypothetical protein BC739_004522 [Kutzneria viridogrisea]|uniref:DUF3043 domain-containing protein n=1 Tax=Kutzneria viridogrisea TaxID=47990 RepID=A0ABR6BK90_9PSEU|nr:DUF3043 domain-containing protein [Kutzneria albida]MBA8927316.1 hypothetical protein [Kutzneria viridogrisea]
MRFLRRNQADSTTTAEEGAVDIEPSADGAKGHTPGKGRPTPKRRDAEGRRRGPVPPPPRTFREARARGTLTKEQRRQEAADRRQKMMAGDDRYLMPKDRGPAKALARDIIDSRRNLMGLFLFMALVVLATYPINIIWPELYIQSYVMLACIAFLLAMVIEAVMLGRIVARKVREKYPDDLTRTTSFIWYTFTRASQARRLRVPKPRVRAGEAV